LRDTRIRAGLAHLRVFDALEFVQSQVVGMLIRNRALRQRLHLRRRKRLVLAGSVGRCAARRSRGERGDGEKRCECVFHHGLECDSFPAERVAKVF
jgi:hypothetical protein